MRSPLIVADRLADWASFAAGPEVLSAADYLRGEGGAQHPSRIINLCHDTVYQGSGYYVSLLAEARGKRALPSVRTLLELGDESRPGELLRLRRSICPRDLPLPQELRIHFGRCAEPRLAALAAAVFQRHPAPSLVARLERQGEYIVATDLQLGHLGDCNVAEETLFAESLDHFSRRLWRSHHQRSQRYDLAILVDPDESLPPSNRSAIRAFERAARGLGFDPEIIIPADAPRLLEFDALLIRCTTAIDHCSYQLARQARREGLAVIDDPDSILRCCNKVFLHDLLAAHRVPMPASRLVMREPAPDYRALIDELGLPLVLKIPDGSFSRGVYKVEGEKQLRQRCDDLLRDSAVIIAQAFVPTPFDWRIGVLEGRALYACRYHMARDHWQIINHGTTGGGRLGRHDCLPLSQVPGPVLRVAIKAAKLIGNGLYGVDLKHVDGQALVIEVNDNPSIDAGIEDEILGDELYRQIVAHLMAGVQARGRQNTAS